MVAIPINRLQRRWSSRVTLAALGAVALSVLQAGGAAAQITDVNPLQTAEARLGGSYSFAYTPSVPGASFTWSVERRRASSSSGTFGSPTTVTSTACGTVANSAPTITCNLAASTSNETVYTIRVREGTTEQRKTVQVFPANVRSFFTYENPGHPAVLVYLTMPSTFNPAKRPLLVMHGVGRDGNVYCDYWKDWAVRTGTLVLCPTFTDSRWPSARSYNQGNVVNSSGQPNPESAWSFTAVENVHAIVRSAFGITEPTYDLWGHSAGGQFTHRFMLFKPNAPVRYAMPANAGWYTAPALNIDWQCGLRNVPGVPFDSARALATTQRPMVIFRGDRDKQGIESNTPETNGCMSTPGQAQGPDRYTRAKWFCDKGYAVNPQLAWRLVDVRGVGHDGKAMAQNPTDGAQKFLEDPVAYLASRTVAGLPCQ